MERKGVLNAFWLKLIMAALMVLDHIYYFFPEQTPVWFTVLGRLVAPVFAYLMTESLWHTRDRGAYIRRLLTWGLGMLAVNIVLAQAFGKSIPMDIFLSLAIGAGMISTIDSLRQHGPSLSRLAGLALLLGCSVLTEGMFIMPALSLVFYYLRHNKLLMCAACLAVSAGCVWLLHPLGIELRQLWMMAAIVPILLYNGRRGPSNAFTKYFFYIFYPAHIYLLFLLRQWG